MRAVGAVKKMDGNKLKRVTKMCCVPQCDNKADGTLSFHQFPTDLDLRKRWVVNLRMGKPATDAMRVCGDHFVTEDFFPGAALKSTRRLKKNSVPTQKIPKRTCEKVENEEAIAVKRQRLQRRLKRKTVLQVKAAVTNVSNDDQPSGDDTLVLDEHAEPQPQPQQQPPGMKETVSISTQTIPLEKPIMKTTKLMDVLASPEKLKNFTGLHSFELLDAIVDCVSEVIVERKVQKDLDLRSRVILTFTRLKLNLQFTTMGILFGTSRTTCANYFKELIPILKVVLEVMVPFPDHEDIKLNIPKSFNKFRDTRAVLDCAETPIERSKCLMCRILTWSNYKGKQTAKFDVCVTPSGLISHVSRAYGGRASDKHIVNHSGILDKMVYRDAVMTDKGFRIEEECLKRNLTLHRPPFVIQKKQMPRAEALKCAEIARARVHVERVIQRMREFQFMCDPIPWELLPYFDDVLIIVAGIVNLGPPVMNIDKFM